MCRHILESSKLFHARVSNTKTAVRWCRGTFVVNCVTRITTWFILITITIIYWTVRPYTGRILSIPSTTGACGRFRFEYRFGFVYVIISQKCPGFDGFKCISNRILEVGIREHRNRSAAEGYDALFYSNNSKLFKMITIMLFFIIIKLIFSEITARRWITLYVCELCTLCDGTTSFGIYTNVFEKKKLYVHTEYVFYNKSDRIIWYTHTHTHTHTSMCIVMRTERDNSYLTSLVPDVSFERLFYVCFEPSTLPSPNTATRVLLCSRRTCCCVGERIYDLVLVRSNPLGGRVFFIRLFFISEQIIGTRYARKRYNNTINVCVYARSFFHGKQKPPWLFGDTSRR